VIRNGCYTVVNPRTGGNRTIRIRALPKSFNARPGTRFAEYLGEGYPRGVTSGPGAEKVLMWIGFAFVNPDGMPVTWSRFRGPEYKSQVAALRFILVNPRGAALLPWFETNFQRLYEGTPVALDPENPNLVDAAAGVAARCWADQEDIGE
jgi:hypothetical protein